MGNSISHCEEAAVEVVEAAPVVEVEEVEEVVEEVEVEEPKKEIVIGTSPIDPRYPNTNQARHCFVAYNEAQKCFSEKGAEAGDCAKLARNYRSICPVEWVEKWNEARENGAWWGKY